MLTRDNPRPEPPLSPAGPPALLLLGWLGLFLLAGSAVLGPAPAAAAPPQRCLSSLDCPNRAPCINRRCFRGLKIVVDASRTSSYRIAIAPIQLVNLKSKANQKLGHKLYRQIDKNFKRLMGTFKILSRRSFLEQPPHNGIELGTFKFAPWRKIGANGLIKMGLRKNTSGQLVLQFRFYDIDASQMALRINQPIEPKYYRWHIHQLCDKVYKYLTGQPGIFATKIAYVQRNPKGGKDIWVVDFDGTNRRRLVSNGHLNLMPSWSPDGRYVLFTSYMDGRPSLYRVEVGTGRVHRQSSRRGTYTGAVYSPDSSKIAVSWANPNAGGSSDIYVMEANGGKMRRLTKAWGIDTSPTWSPDGKMLAFVSERFAHPHIFLMSSDGSNQTRLTYKGDYNQEPRWSPRNNEILFTARDEYLKYDLFVITIKQDNAGKIQTKYRRLTQNQGTNLEAGWSPDGRFIVFISTRYGERKMLMMNADGTHQRLFIRGIGDFETPAWSPLLPHPRVVASGKPRPRRRSKATARDRVVARTRKAPPRRRPTSREAPTRRPAPDRRTEPAVRSRPAARRRQPARRTPPTPRRETAPRERPQPDDARP